MTVDRVEVSQKGSKLINTSLPRNLTITLENFTSIWAGKSLYLDPKKPRICVWTSIYTYIQRASKEATSLRGLSS